jgi:(p)ppGpp synthase/HD superfamily hydrolase
MYNLAEEIKKALDFAVKAHGDQRYGPHPYKFHLLSALSVGFEFGVTEPKVLIALALHDTIEDTEATHNELDQEFGVDVADLVHRVSNEQGRNRKARSLATYPKIAPFPSARLVKLADRIANTRNCWIEVQDRDANKRNKSKLGMYRKEYGGFRKALRPAYLDDGGWRGPEALMWNELDRLMAWED